jgi:hypothetical protein
MDIKFVWCVQSTLELGYIQQKSIIGSRLLLYQHGVLSLHSAILRGILGLYYEVVGVLHSLLQSMLGVLSDCALPEVARDKNQVKKITDGCWWSLGTGRSPPPPPTILQPR